MKTLDVFHYRKKASPKTAGAGNVGSKFLLILLLAAFLVRMCWIVAVRPLPVCDFSFYYNQGVSISQGQGYIGPDGSPTAFWPVGYPAFLAMLFHVFGSSLFVGKFANVILSVCTLAVFYKFALIISEGKNIAMLATAIVAFFPSQIAFCSLISDTILFQFLLYSALFVLCRSTSLFSIFFSGAIFGFAAYVRPYVILLPLIYPLVYWRSLRLPCVLKFTALVYLGMLVVVMPWTVRNYIAFGGFVPISNNGGFNLLIGNSPYATGRYNDLKLDAEHYSNEFELDRDARQMAVGYMIRHPARTVVRFIPKLFYMYCDDANALWWNLAGYRYTNSSPPAQEFRKDDLPWVAVFQLYYFLLLIGAVGFVIFNYILKKQIPYVHPLGLNIVVYFSLIAMVFFGDPRFRLPVNPLFALYSSAVLFFLVRFMNGYTAGSVPDSKTLQ